MDERKETFCMGILDIITIASRMGLDVSESWEAFNEYRKEV